MSIFLDKYEDDFLEFNLYASDDKYKVFMDLIPKKAMSPEDTSTLLDYSFIVKVIKKHLSDIELIHYDVIKDIIKSVKEGQKCQGRRIAKGYAPHEGIPERIVYLVKKYDKTVYKNGKVDFMDIRYTSYFDNVKKGDKVARIYGAKYGAPGKNALGEEIRGELGKKLNLKISGDFHCEKEPNANYITLVSLRDGFVKEESGYVCIKEELIIEGDSNYESGRINFVGSVYVKGDVYKDFIIHAGKSVVIDGHTHQANITTDTGDIYVKGFILGGEKSKISSGGAIFSKGCRDANLEAKSSIYLEKEAYNSKISTLESLYVKKGVIVGGNSFVINSVIANEVGNKSEIQTQINVCSEREIVLIHRDLKERLKIIEKVREGLVNYLGNIATNPNEILKVKEEYRSNMRVMLKKYKEATKIRDGILLEINKLTAEKTINNKFFLEVKSNVFPGTCLKTQETDFKILDKEKGPLKIIFKDNLNFIMEKYNE